MIAPDYLKVEKTLNQIKQSEFTTAIWEEIHFEIRNIFLVQEIR